MIAYHSLMHINADIIEMMSCVLGNMSNVTLREQCHSEAKGVHLWMTLFSQGYIECIAQHTGQHLLSCMTINKNKLKK